MARRKIRVRRHPRRGSIRRTRRGAVPYRATVVNEHQRLMKELRKERQIAEEERRIVEAQAKAHQEAAKAERMEEEARLKRVQMLTEIQEAKRLKAERRVKLATPVKELLAEEIRAGAMGRGERIKAVETTKRAKIAERGSAKRVGGEVRKAELRREIAREKTRVEAYKTERARMKAVKKEPQVVREYEMMVM